MNSFRTRLIIAIPVQYANLIHPEFIQEFVEVNRGRGNRGIMYVAQLVCSRTKLILEIWNIAVARK